MDLIIFSDLDGTLLDHHDYSWQAAAPALAAIREQGVPLILCSSKTRAEMTPLQKEMGITGPLICENGGGIFAPKGLPLIDHDHWRVTMEDMAVIRIGMPIEELRERFAGFKERFGARGFGDMSDAEVAGLTGLSLQKAALARRREFNEPLLLEHPERDYVAFCRAAHQAGLQVTRGGRFVHLLGGGDKGKAVRRLIDIYRAIEPGLVSMALGDAPNDAPMLAEVDRPVLVARPDGSHADLGDLPLQRQPDIGPQGWNQAVLRALAELA